MADKPPGSSTIDPPGPARIDIWTTSLDRTPQFDRSILSDEERAGFVRLTDLKSRRRALQLRAFVRTVLGEYLGVRPADVGFLCGPHGKPLLDPEQSRLHCSWTRSEGLAAIAISRFPVGIDLELRRTLPSPEAVAGYALSLDELRTWRVLPDGQRSATLLRSWVRKEAIAKADGRGLEMGLEHVDIQREGGDASGYVSLGNRLGYHWADWSCPQGYFGALGSPRPIGAVRVRDWEGTSGGPREASPETYASAPAA